MKFVQFFILILVLDTVYSLRVIPIIYRPRSTLPKKQVHSTTFKTITDKAITDIKDQKMVIYFYHIFVIFKFILYFFSRFMTMETVKLW